MENSKVKSLIDYRQKQIGQSELQPANVFSPTVTPRPRLLDQVRQAIRTRHYSYMTEKAYVGWIKRFLNLERSSGIIFMSRFYRKQ